MQLSAFSHSWAMVPIRAQYAHRAFTVGSWEYTGWGTRFLRFSDVPKKKKREEVRLPRASLVIWFGAAVRFHSESRFAPESYFLFAFLRSMVDRMRLRKRIDSGVISTSSSSSMYSSASSSVNVIGGVS